MSKCKTFTKDQRGTFRYWHWHWKAINAIARKFSIWKPHHLSRDTEKPFLKIFLPYEKVQAIHRRNNKHHLEHRHPDKRNREDMMSQAGNAADTQKKRVQERRFARSNMLA